MRRLNLSLTTRLAGYAPLVARIILGTIMATHGLQKLGAGPTNVGERELASLGVPLPVFTAYVVTFIELIGGILLIVGLLSRLAALVLAIDRIAALLLGKVYIGRIIAYLLLKINAELIVPSDNWISTELDLALIAGFLVVVFAGPGKLALDYVLGLEKDVVEERSEQERVRNTT